MQITLDQPEIELAVQQFVMNNFPFLAGQNVGIEFTATRGDKGITAALNISAAQIAQAPAAAPVAAAAPKLAMPSRKTGAPAAVAQPKPTPAPVEEPAGVEASDETESETAEMSVEDAVASISTGEVRVDPEQPEETPAEEAPSPKVNPFKKAVAPKEEAPAADEAPKAARSIFSKAS